MDLVLYQGSPRQLELYVTLWAVWPAVWSVVLLWCVLFLWGCFQPGKPLTTLMPTEELMRNVVTWIRIEEQWKNQGLPSGTVDHSPLLLELVKLKSTYPKPFRFFNAWMGEPSCKETIREAWKGRYVGASSAAAASFSDPIHTAIV